MEILTLLPCPYCNRIKGAKTLHFHSEGTRWVGIVEIWHSLNRSESGRFGALKSDSTHHFFGNACTKSGSLRLSQFPVVDWFCLIWVLTFPLEDCSEFGNFVITLIYPLLDTPFYKRNVRWLCIMNKYTMRLKGWT